jgi:transcriptional regulator GlxA family with amidase domain
VPVAQVAAVTGFCDQSHLSRVVKRLYGRQPTRLAPE